uniref:Uncharacterized protein n=1 Tax=Caenorhabditis japonica TaxID=281687 RepID=A0A8R1ET30_CAEJA
MGRGLDPYMIRYRSTRPRGGSVDCFGVGRRGSTPAWNIYGGRVDPWENGNISDPIWIHVSLVEGTWNFLTLWRMDPRSSEAGRVDVRLY